MVCIVRLKGGLGNQLFQYAFGRAASARTGTALLLDTGFLNSKDPQITPREYALAPFRVAAKLVNAAQLRQFPLRTSRAGLWLARRGIANHGCRYVWERGFAYDATALEGVRLPAIFEGYWQSEKYFLSCENLVREDLRIDESPDFRALAQEVSDARSVSVHVRRGDYVTNAAASATHGLCPLSYYESCFEQIEAVVPNPRYYLFTDDPQWAENNEKAFGRDLVLVSRQARLQAHEELLLMSRCRHHILANSSFSWWGAWLDRRTDGLVMAPDRWFKTGTDTADLLPARWRRL